MSDWAAVFLGVIAVATLATAIVQIGVLVAASRLARRLDRLADQLEREAAPIVGHLNAIGRDAARAASLAVTQVERADRMFADLGQRLDETLAAIHISIVKPAREGAAILSAVRAVVEALRSRRGRVRGRSEEEDALFI